MASWLHVAFDDIWRNTKPPIIERNGVPCLTPGLGRDIVLVREEYTKLWKYVEKEAADPDRASPGGLAVVGQPGIGE